MNVGEIDVVDENGWKCMKVDEIRRKFMKVDDHLVTICWPFVDHLLTTCWPFDDYFWLFSDQSVTTYWSFGDYLVTIWWPFGDHLVTTLSVILQFFLSSSLCDHLVTPQHNCKISFFCTSKHRPSSSLWSILILSSILSWYIFFEGFERYVHNKKQISRDIYDIRYYHMMILPWLLS